MKFHSSESFVDRSGKVHESFLLGEVNTQSPAYQQEMKKAGADGRGYLTFREALELVKKFQPIDRITHKPEDPTNPHKAFPRDLRIAIADALGLENDEDLDRLKFYTAVGSPLDYFHGVDAFVSLEGKNPGEPEKIVTFDVTLKEEASAKKDAKANVVIRQLEPEKSQKQIQELDEIARRAAPFLSGPARA